MKTDAQIQFDAEQELKWDASVTHEHIGVAVLDSIVSLSGYVPNYIEKAAAVKAVQRVSGVKAVVDKMEVQIPGSDRRDDQAIAKAIIDAFRWNVQVPDNKIKVDVEKGWVTLTGETEWEYQRRSAESAVRRLAGVHGITNKIELRPKPIYASQIQLHIEEALKRAAEREADRINVTIEGTRVILSGQVRSFAELRAVKGAAWNAPGVTSVDDSGLRLAA